MTLIRKSIILISLAVLCQAGEKEYRKKYKGNLKRAVESYSYPVPNVRFDEKPEKAKTKVVVETIKSISPAEYLTTTGYLSGNFETSTGDGKISTGTVTYNAFEAADTSKKPSTVGTVSDETTSAKKKPSNKHFSSATSSTQRSMTSTGQTSTLPPAPVRITSVEPATTLMPGYQYTSRTSSGTQSASASTTVTEDIFKKSNVRGKIVGNGYQSSKGTKKPSKIEPKQSDSKPEETEFNGYHYNVGSLSFESKPAGPQNGMMGLSYMRSSSPYYNYHVMLD